jgi:hypothetical protein
MDKPPLEGQAAGTAALNVAPRLFAQLTFGAYLCRKENKLRWTHTANRHESRVQQDFSAIHREGRLVSAAGFELEAFTRRLSRVPKS